MGTSTSSTAGTVVFLHGLGAGPESWDVQRRELPPGFEGTALPIAGLSDGGGGDFSLERAVDGVRDELDVRGIERAHLCGLSLGAMVALQLAAGHPGRVGTLTLSGGQVRPNPALMKFQLHLLRLLPARIASAPGVSKRRFLAVLEELAEVDLRPSLAKINAPTLVLCGTRDRANLPGSRELAAGLPRAELEIVPGAKHQWNTQLPHEFSTRLNRFLTETASAEGSPEDQ